MYVGRNVVVCIFCTEQFGQSSGSFSLSKDVDAAHSTFGRFAAWRIRGIVILWPMSCKDHQAEKTAVLHKQRTSVYRIRILVIHFREALPSSSTWHKVASDQPGVVEMVHKCVRSDSDTPAALRSLHD
eukprot:s2052_g20.t1